VGAEVLIVAAVEGELEALRGFERDGSWDACAVGLGLVAATIGTVLRLSKGAPARSSWLEHAAPMKAVGSVWGTS